MKVNWNPIQKKRPLSKTDFSDADQKIFWESVQKQEKSDCWIWTGKSCKKWSFFVHKGRCLSCVRVAFAIESDVIPEHIRLMRTCKNEKCINPNHCDRYSNLPGLKLNRHAYVKLWRKRNPGKCAAYCKKHWNKNPTLRRGLNRINYRKNWPKYRDKKQARVKFRYKSDSLFKLKKLIRGRFSQALKQRRLVKVTAIFSVLGCSIEELRQHLQSQFKPGMTWANHGSSWHIDHVIPLARAKTYQEVYSLSHYTNLQPLWKSLNFIKGCR